MRETGKSWIYWVGIINDNAQNYYENIKWVKLEDSVNSDQRHADSSPRKSMTIAKNEEVKKWKN